MPGLSQKAIEYLLSEPFKHDWDCPAKPRGGMEQLAGEGQEKPKRACACGRDEAIAFIQGLKEGHHG